MSTVSVNRTPRAPGYAGLLFTRLHNLVGQRITLFTSSGKGVTGEFINFELSSNSDENVLILSGKHAGDPESIVWFKHVSMLRPAKEDE